MLLRIGFLASLVAMYFIGVAMKAQGAPVWAVAALMGVVFIGLVAAMYAKVLPALLALPILAIALAAIAGMKWDAIFTTVVQDGSIRLSKWIIAAILGSVLAQVVEKTGIAQTAIKKTAELGGDRPAILAVLLTIVIALLFTTLGGLGAVIMVATIVVPILLSLGLRPLYVGCLFLLAMSLGGAFNMVNWQGYKDMLGMNPAQIIAFALPFAGLMLITTFLFLAIEGKRMGKARYKAVVTETETTHAFVPWYALLTPVIPLLPVLFFALLPKMYQKPAEIQVSIPQNAPSGLRVWVSQESLITDRLSSEMQQPMKPGEVETLSPGKYYVWNFYTPENNRYYDPVKNTEIQVDAWTKIDLQVTSSDGSIAVNPVTSSTAYDFPITVALLLGIIYGAVTTWRKGQSTVQLIVKSSFDGVAAVGPALVLMVGIGMVLNATMSAEVSGIISPVLSKIVPGDAPGVGNMVHYVLLFTILAPLALYRGPLNMYGMGAGLIGALKPMMPGGAIMGAFMATGMIQGVCDPTNTHNVWMANYTNTDVQDILKRTLPYMWALAFVGLLLSAVLYYGGVIK